MKVALLALVGLIACADVKAEVKAETTSRSDTIRVVVKRAPPPKPDYAKFTQIDGLGETCKVMVVRHQWQSIRDNTVHRDYVLLRCQQYNSHPATYTLLEAY